MIIGFSLGDPDFFLQIPTKMLGYRGWPTSLKEGLDLPHLFRVPTHPLENPVGQHPFSSNR